MNLTINDKLLKQLESTKILGIVFDKKLNFYEHIAKTAKKITQKVYGLRKLSFSLPKSSLNLLVKSTILPIIDYASVLWSFTCHLNLIDINSLYQK